MGKELWKSTLEIYNHDEHSHSRSAASSSFQQIYLGVFGTIKLCGCSQFSHCECRKWQNLWKLGPCRKLELQTAVYTNSLGLEVSKKSIYRVSMILFRCVYGWCLITEYGYSSWHAARNGRFLKVMLLCILLVTQLQPCNLLTLRQVLQCLTNSTTGHLCICLDWDNDDSVEYKWEMWL